MAKPKAEILDKLAKMIRHEQSARDIGSIAEAEAFAGKVQELLTAHGLEMSDVDFTEESSEPIDVEWAWPDEGGVKVESKRIQWQEELASAVALNNNCALLISRVSNAVCFVGRPADRQICLALYRYFVRLALDVAEKTAKEQRDIQREKCKAQWTDPKYYTGAGFRWWMVRFKKSFCMGFGHALCMRFYEQRKEMEKTAESTTQGSSALIHLRDNREAIDTFLGDMFKDRKERKVKDNDDSRERKNWEAFQDGKRAGNKVALTSGALTA